MADKVAVTATGSLTGPPLCRCHDIPMEWNKDSRPRFDGGYWRCKVKHRAARRRYKASAKGRDTQSRYRNSPTGKLTHQLLEMTRVRVRY